MVGTQRSTAEVVVESVCRRMAIDACHQSGHTETVRALEAQEDAAREAAASSTAEAQAQGRLEELEALGIAAARVVGTITSSWTHHGEHPHNEQVAETERENQRLRSAVEDLAKRLALADEVNEAKQADVMGDPQGPQGMAVLQAALIELATANTELEAQVRQLEAEKAQWAQQAELDEEECEDLCDMVLAGADPEDLALASQYLLGLGEIPSSPARQQQHTPRGGCTGADVSSNTPPVTPIKSKMPMSMVTPPRVERNSVSQSIFDRGTRRDK